ncbi:MAG: 60S ribosomal protein L31 [Candidatus Aenigmarchaeota archaeon]|jgi:large subunit ribosomal protein L31e|nr:60S ribosomal protein L31 [Candidatus Aenigmarchaeota archaeon]
MAEEKYLTLNLRKIIIKKQRWRRSEAAVFALKKLLRRHLKTDKIKISQALNNLIWKRGGKKPETKIRIKAVKEGEYYKVDLAS